MWWALFIGMQYAEEEEKICFKSYSRSGRPASIPGGSAFGCRCATQGLTTRAFGCRWSELHVQTDMTSSKGAVCRGRAPSFGQNRVETPGRMGIGQRICAKIILLTVLVSLCQSLALVASEEGAEISGSWPRGYAVSRDNRAGLLTLSTPFYTVSHDLRRGGAIAAIRLTHGRATNLLAQPIFAHLRDETGALLTEAKDAHTDVSHRRDGLTEIVTVGGRLYDDQGRKSKIRVRTVFEYHWGYIKIHKEFNSPQAIRVYEVCPFTAVLTPALSDYGYREGVTEQEGAPAFSFGSAVWGKLRGQASTDRPLSTRFVPRSILFADPGTEGLEWFAGSDLSQWDLQLTGRRGQGLSLLQLSENPAGIAVAISPLFVTNAPVALPRACKFDFYLGLPILEGHALRPWLHTSFNRNQGNWVTPEQIGRWAETGIQTIHCHNDGDYYNDGLFWRDGAYPPYPDMEKYNRVVTNAHQAGIRVATYFSNKELHPSTAEFREHGLEWGRMNGQGKLQHNIFSGTNEFGVQMCLRSGWLAYLKHSIDRVLKNHPLDGVYYDWNVALLCCNGGHEGKKPGEMGAEHWDIDELLDLMEWTRRRVGPRGLVIVHNTTTPMYATENFADHVVANEWGYGTWKDDGPELAELPLEWSLAGARSRGVISYGQLNAQSPKRLHRLFALEALLGGVTPWPASAEAFELCSLLKPLGKIEGFRFADWRNQAVTLDRQRCASAVYSRPGESYILVGNLDKDPQEVRCVLHPERLPYPLSAPSAATMISGASIAEPSGEKSRRVSLNAAQLLGEGVKVTIPADSAVLIQVR